MAKIAIMEDNWSELTLEVSEGSRYKLKVGNRFLSFFEVVRYLGYPAFSLSYSNCVLQLGFEDFFWEHPAVTLENLDQPYEVSIVPTTAFTGRAPNYSPFQRKFDLGQSNSVFENLSGSAILVVPNPDVGQRGEKDYGSFSRFLQNAEDEKVVSLFKVLSDTWLEQLQRGSDYKYVSTHGLGVIWLHVRLDQRPKYYHTLLYRN